MDNIQVTGGEKRMINGETYTVQGYVTLSNGEKKILYSHGLTGYGYFDDNGDYQIAYYDFVSKVTKMPNGEDVTINKLSSGESIVPSGMDKNIINNPNFAAYEGNLLKRNAVVGINDVEYRIEGYATINGENIIIYRTLKYDTFYLDKNGQIVSGKKVIYSNDTFIIDGQEVVINRTDELIEPSERDRKFLGGSDITTIDDISEQTDETKTKIEVETTKNVNREYSLKELLTVNRKKYYIKKYDATAVNDDYYINREFEAKEKRTLTIKTYRWTPGQGDLAKASAIDFEECIGSIATLLEEVEELAPKAIRTADYPNGYVIEYIKYIRNSLEEITPSIYTNFAERALKRTVSSSLNAQTAENNYVERQAYEEKEYLESQHSAWKLKVEVDSISSDSFFGYSGYLSGNDYTSASTNRPGIYCSTTNDSRDVDAYINYANTDMIIDDLRQIVNGFICHCNEIIEEQVKQINSIINGYTSHLGVLKPEHVNEKLIELRERIKKLIDKFEDAKANLGSYDGKGDAAPSHSQTKTPISTGYQTPSQTEVSTERPTVPVTTEPTTNINQTTTEETTQSGGPLPSVPVSGNNNGNVNSNGNGNYYWGENNNSYSDSSSDTSTTESTVTTEPTFDIKEGNKYKLPKSTPISTTTTTTTTTSQGSSVVPVLAGLAAAAAAGIGAKAYIDRKNNRDNESEEEFKSEDWSTNNDINIEYHEPTNTEVETLDFDDVKDDYEIEETEKYGARTYQDLEKLQ